MTVLPAVYYLRTQEAQCASAFLESAGEELAGDYAAGERKHQGS